MPDTAPEWIREMLARQAAWQRSRKDLPWPVKVEMARLMRDAALVLRATAPAATAPAATAPAATAPAATGSDQPAEIKRPGG